MNISKQLTSPELTVANSLIYSARVSIAIGIILSILTLMTIVFNLGGALIFFRDKNLHTFSDSLILNLMLVDGSIGLLVMPLKVILALTSDVWVWSRDLCLTFMTVEATTNLVSIVNTLMVTLDHYWLVRNRQKYTAQQTHFRLLFMCISPWIIVMVFYGWPHFLWEFQVSQNSLQPGSCTPPYQTDFAVNLVLLLSPSALIIAVPVFDTLMYYTLRRQLFHKLKCLLQTGRVEVRDLSSLGLIPETDAKSVTKIYSDACSCNEIEDSKQSQSSLHQDYSNTSEVREESRSVNIALTAQPATLKPQASNVTNSNCNADNPSATSLELSTDTGSLAVEQRKPPGQEAGEAGSTKAAGKEVEGRVEALKEFASEMREARLSLTLGVVLVFTWVPCESMDLAGNICDMVQGCVFPLPSRLLQGCRWWVLLGSLVNPVLIFTLDSRYWAALCHFVCGSRRQSSPAENTAPPLQCCLCD